MDDQRLWAPWRIGYIRGTISKPDHPDPDCWIPGAEPDCFFCRAAGEFASPLQAHKHHLVIRRRSPALTLLNRYPYANGHLLVAPLRHVADPTELTPEEHLALMQSVTDHIKQLREVMNAQGFNVGLNLGPVAGAGTPGHLHWHIVPRWPGDHNFMPTVAGVSILPESLDELWNLLSDP